MKKIKLEVSAQDALLIADGALPAVSKDDVTPILTGAHFSATGDRVVVVSTDRYRVHRVAVGFTDARNRSVFEFVQPEERDDRDDGRVTVTVHAQHSDETAQIGARLIAGRFPPVGGLIDEVKKSPTSTKERLLAIRFLTDVQKAVGRYGRVVIRHTENPEKHGKQSPTHVWCDGWFDALIQPHLV